MKRFIACSIILFLLAIRAEAEQTAEVKPPQEREPVTIPLDQIWGYHLPGTRDIAGVPLPEPKAIGETDASFRRQRERYIEQIRRSLASKAPTERALWGFVLPRPVDFYTLRRASSGLEVSTRRESPDRVPPKKTYSVNDELTLVFFTHPASYYVRLKEVKRSGEEITVRYQFEPHATVETTVHFALIPLGKLPAGNYRVNFEQIPLDQKYRDAGFEPVWQEDPYLVSRPFSFEVWEPTDPEPLAEGTRLIPLDEIWAYKMLGTKDIGELDIVKLPSGLKKRPTIDAMRASLTAKNWPKEGEKTEPGFVVEGTGREALIKAAAVLTKKEKVPQRVAADTDLSLVFYSYSLTPFVQIASVEQSEKQIRVKYRFANHGVMWMNSYFALIPIGKLPPGEVKVIIEQTASMDPRGEEQPPLRDIERFVCDSFTFEVQK